MMTMMMMMMMMVVMVMMMLSRGEQLLSLVSCNVMKSSGKAKSVSSSMV